MKKWLNWSLNNKTQKFNHYDVKTLLILRHAKSSWQDATLADHDRPLNKRGQRNAPQMGAWLYAQGNCPDYVVSSTAVRARETALAVMIAAHYEGPCLLLPQLYHATPRMIEAVVQALPVAAERVLLVGHNPGLEELVARVTQQAVRLPTAAVVQLRLPLLAWPEFTLQMPAELGWVQLPKDLED